jgi:hypothetical protein
MYTNVTQHYADHCAARQSGICLSLVSANSTSQLVPFLKHTPFLEAVMREVRLETQSLYSTKKFHDQPKDCQFTPNRLLGAIFVYNVYTSQTSNSTLTVATRYRQSVVLSTVFF